MTEHAAAPWRWNSHYEDMHGKGDMLISNNGNGVYVCHAYWQIEGKAKKTTDKWQAERKANMKVIAAAPDLLEALRGLLADITEYQAINNLGGEDNHWQIRARDAIIKATQ